MPTPFRFAAVLRLREIERDEKRRALAEEIARESKLLVEQQQLNSERLALTRELEAMQSPNSEGAATKWRADQILSRHQAIQHLADQVIAVESQLQATRHQIRLCHEQLVAINSAVKGLDKLAEQHRQSQAVAEQKCEEQDRDDRRFPHRAA